MTKIEKCCKDFYCGFPAWTNTTCIFCGKGCTNCEIGKELLQSQQEKVRR